MAEHCPPERSEKRSPSTSSTRRGENIFTLELEVEYPDESTAVSVLRALEPDNNGYVESELQGNIIVFRMSSDNAGTLRNTADDLMACIKAAETIVTHK